VKKPTQKRAASPQSERMTPVMVKMPSDLIALLDERARLEHRTRSNLIVHLLYTSAQQAASVAGAA
jgi:hypothetical protein